MLAFSWPHSFSRSIHHSQLYAELHFILDLSPPLLSSSCKVSRLFKIQAVPSYFCLELCGCFTCVLPDYRLSFINVWQLWYKLRGPPTEPVDMLSGSGNASGTVVAVKQCCDLQSQTNRVIITRLPAEQGIMFCNQSLPGYGGANSHPSHDLCDMYGTPLACLLSVHPHPQELRFIHGNKVEIIN